MKITSKASKSVVYEELLYNGGRYTRVKTITLWDKKPLTGKQITFEVDWYIGHDAEAILEHEGKFHIELEEAYQKMKGA